LFAEPFSAISLGLAPYSHGRPPAHTHEVFHGEGRGSRAEIGLYATNLRRLFHLVIPLLGFGAVVIPDAGLELLPTSVPADSSIRSPSSSRDEHGAVHLADAARGPALLGFMSAVAFATILAVVAGLKLAGASAVSHDI